MSDQLQNEKHQPKLVSLSERRQQDDELKLKQKLENLSKAFSGVVSLNPEQVVLSYTYRESDDDVLTYEVLHYSRDEPLDWDVFGLLEVQRTYFQNYLTEEFEDE